MAQTKFQLSGVYPALVTPFNKDESVDELAMRNLIRYVIKYVDGIVVCGTTGEFVYLSINERKRLYELAVDEVNGKCAVIAGTGACSTKTAIELTRYADDCGADACLVVAPYFLHPSDKGIHEHFWQVANNVDIPIIMYNIPQTTGTYISRKVIEDLAELPTIVGLKDSSGNLPYTLEVLEKVRDKINVVIGHDEIVLPALAAGCSGMILASAQIFPEIWRRIYEAVVDKNDLVTARELQFQVQKLTRIFCRLGGPVPIKIALNLLGIKVGVTRAPLKVGGTLIHEDREEIRLELEKLGKLPVQNIDFELSSDQPLETRFEVIGLKPKEILTGQIRLGTGAAGEPNSPEAVRLDLVLGKKTTRLGEVFAEQLTHPRHGYEALTTIMEPNLTVRPSTLIVPQVALKNLRQANMIYGPTQAAVGKAVVDCIACGLITPDMVEDYVIIVSVFVHPQAIDRHLLYKNVYDAMVHALEEALKNI